MVSSVKEILAEAARKSREYEWLEAAALYQKAVKELEPQGDPLEVGRLTELVARSYFKAAFQAENREEFKHRMRLAEEEYQKAQKSYENAGSEPLLKRAKARQLFAVFWLKEDLEEWKGIIAESISLAGEAAKVSEAQGDRRGLAEAQKDLLYYLYYGMGLTTEWTVLKEQFDTVVGITDSVVNGFEALGDDEGLVESLYVIVYTLPGYFDFVYGPTEVGEIAERTVELSGKLRTVAERIGTPDALCMANISVFCATANLETDQSKLRTLAETAVSAAEKTRDLDLIASSLAIVNWWIGLETAVEEDPDRRRQLLERDITVNSTAIERFRITGFSPYLGWGYSALGGNYLNLADLVEIEPERKREYLKKAVEAARNGLNYAKGLPLVVSPSRLSRALYLQATIEPNPQEKKKLLEEALVTGEEHVRDADLLFHPLALNRGIFRRFQALVKAELAKMNQDPKAKEEILRRAVEDLQVCVDLCAQWAKSPARLSGSRHYGYYESYGDVLLQLYNVAHEPDIARQAIKAYDDAVADLTRLELVASIAPLRWKVARAHDSLGDYGQALDAFKKAAESYRAGAKKVPGSAQTFEELASYMDAWFMIEEAQLNHDEEQYAAAAENYEKAAKTLEKTRSWNTLSNHYRACSLLEQGEAASRLERTISSTETFVDAVKTFQEMEAVLEDQLKRSSGLHQNEELQHWISINQQRGKYCQGRIELERAKTLDMQGYAEGSAKKYHSAAEAFKALLAEAHVEQSRRELETLGLFCEAWTKMKEAEASASPEPYAEAAAMFRRAEQASTRKRYRLLALANASICKALESGTLFRRTRNTQLYSEIKIQLETATDYYQEAGLQRAAEWTRATGNLFDALVQLTDATSERESKKKTELYRTAEKHLELAAKLYDEAGFGSRRDEAAKHLKRVREEKEVLLTPIEALTESPAVSSVSVVPVSMVRDQATGLERFDVANVVGNLSLSQKDVSVGSDLTLDLELANVGKTAATLIKLQNVATDGLEVERQRITQRVEDNYIDMKGKRLEYLKTHEVKIPLKAIRKGSFEVKPKILYADEQGNYRSYEFNPAVITVKELGITRWLKGPR